MTPVLPSFGDEVNSILDVYELSSHPLNISSLICHQYLSLQPHQPAHNQPGEGSLYFT